jgi:ribonuclease HIII
LNSFFILNYFKFKKLTLNLTKKTILQLFITKFTEAGCDEVGRGCLAGPVVAASVILDEKFNNFLLKILKPYQKLQ